MTVIENYYDELHFTDCDLSIESLGKDRLVIQVSNLGVLPGHPLNTTPAMIFITHCRLVFGGVRKSERSMHEYIGDPTAGIFRTPYTIVDHQSQGQAHKPGTVYELEGVLDHPRAWVDWTIESTAFFMEVEATTSSSSRSG